MDVLRKEFQKSCFKQKKAILFLYRKNGLVVESIKKNLSEI